MTITRKCRISRRLNQLPAAFVLPLSSLGVLLTDDHGWDSWHFGANDNTPGGWIVFALYAVASFLCWLEVGRQISRRTSERAPGSLPPLFWVSLAGGVTLLGINKQPDFQTLLIEFARTLAENNGFYPYHRLVHAVFFVAAATGVLSLIAVLYRFWQRGGRPERNILLATAIFPAFILLRIADINHIGEPLGVNLHHHRFLVAMEAAILIFLCTALIQFSSAERGRRRNLLQ